MDDIKNDVTPPPPSIRDRFRKTPMGIVNDEAQDNYTHTCKFFAFNVKTTFIPTEIKDEDGNTLFRQVDYLFSACNCGRARKTLAESV